MIFRSALLPSLLLALAAAQKHSDIAESAQRSLRTSKAKPVATDNSDVEDMRNEEFKGIWRSLQSDMSMPIEVPSPAPSPRMPVEAAPSLPTSPVVAPVEVAPAPVEVAPSQPSQSPVAGRTGAPVSVPTAPSPVMTSSSDFPSLVPSQSSSSNPVEEPAFPEGIPTNDPSDIQSDMPSDMSSDITTDAPTRTNFP